MKKFYLFLGFVLMGVILGAQIPDGYYDSAQGKTGAELKTALFNIISSHTVLSYNDLWSAYYKTDIDQFYEKDGTILDIYSENPDGPDPYEYTPGSDQCGTYGSEGDCYNREHSFPKSWFNDASPMYTDLFHLYPTDGKVNGMRSNYPYGEVDDPTWTSENGSKLGPCSYPGYSGTVFEPIDEFKGDLARTYFYMATAYEDKIAGWENNTSNSDAVLNGTSYPCFEPWFLEMLLKWNDMDPVSPKEIARNDSIYKIQGNRNPYIDHPEWVHCVFENQCSGLVFTSTPVENAVINQQYTYNITYQTDNEEETFTCEQKPAWLSFSADESNNTGILTGTPTTAGSFDVSLKLVENGNTTYQNFTIVVTDGTEPVDVWNEDFTTCPNDWTAYSVASNKNWDCSTNDYLYINAYGGDVASEDWYISPAINLDDYSNEILTFSAYTKYSDDGVDDPEVRLYYSTDYTSGDPNAANWTELNYNYPADDSQSWTESGNIDLSQISGTNVHIAFKYISSGTGSGSSSIWEIDNIILQATSGNGNTTGGTLQTSVSTLSGFEYVLGNGPSQSQSFTLSGSSLDGSAVTISAPADYEISSDNSVFSSSITLPDYRGNDTIIFVRLKAGRDAGEYNETLNIAGGGAPDLNLALSGQVHTATIMTNVTSLSGFAYNEGSGPSDIKGFVLSGAYLDGSSVTLAAPDNFEISLDSNNFFSVLNIDYTSPDLQDTVVVVRLKAGLAQGTYSGTLTCTDNGSAPQVSVDLDGEVNAVSTTCGGLENFDNLQTGSSSYASGSFTGQDGSTWSYTDSRTDQSIDGASLCIRDGYLISGEISGGIGEITISTQRVFTGTDSLLVIVINNDTVGTVPYTDAVQTTTVSNINVSGNFTLKISTPGNGDRVVVDNISWTCYPAPTNRFLTSDKSSLNGFDYLEGNGPSQPKTITLSGTDLDGSDVELIAPADFELSWDASAYANLLTISAFDGSDTVVYVRLKSGLPKATYANEIMKVGGGGADTILITLNGEVYSPYFNLSDENIFGMSYYLNSGPSNSKSFTISGVGLDGSDVTINAPSDFEVSQDGSTFGTSVVLNSYDGTEKTIYVRLIKNLPVGTYSNEILTVSGGGADTKILGLNGEVLMPYFTATPESLYNFSYYLNNGPSDAKTFTLTGTGLDGSDVTLTAPTNFELSSDGANFDNSLILKDFDGSAATIYARLKAGLQLGAYGPEQIKITGGSASSLFVPLYGDVYKPFLSLNPTVLSGFNYVEGSGPSDSKTFELTGTGIANSDIILTAPTDYEISDDNISFTNSLNLNSFSGDATTIYVRLKDGLTAGNYNNENLEIGGTGLDAVFVTLNGSVSEYTNIEQTNSDINVYPNPVTNGIINISTADNSTKSLILMDISGKILVDRYIRKEIKLDVSGLHKGIYLIKVSGDQTNFVQKIVIK